MKAGKWTNWGWWACGIALIVSGAVWINQNLIQLEQEATTKNKGIFKEKLEKDSDWMRYRELEEKFIKLSKGWVRPTAQLNSDFGSEMGIPIDDAVERQIAEIQRIHEEEILGKISDYNRIFHKYQQKLWNEFKEKNKEKEIKAKAALEGDLESEKRLQNRKLDEFHRRLEEEYQLTLVNLELQLKMVDLSSDPEKQTTEKERIEKRINGIRKVIKEKVDIQANEMEETYELYQKQRTADYYVELSEYRKQIRQLNQVELSRFREQQMDDFEAWRKQRQIEVDRAIELRRSQK